MNKSRFAHRPFLFLLSAGLLAAGSLTAQAQQTLTTRDGVVHPVQILGVERTGIKVQMGAASLTEPFSNVLAVSMEPPAEYTAALAAYQSHDLPKALALAKSVVDKYRGLPADWAQSAMSLLGDIYVDNHQLPQAAAAYQDFQKAYPAAGPARINVGLARIDIANKNYPAAKAKIDPILAEAMKVRNPPPATNAALGQAFLVSGEVKEAGGDFPGALEDYLRTVTIFAADRVAVLDATQRAEALRQAHNVTVP